MANFLDEVRNQLTQCKSKERYSYVEYVNDNIPHNLFDQVLLIIMIYADLLDNPQIKTDTEKMMEEYYKYSRITIPESYAEKFLESDFGTYEVSENEGRVYLKRLQEDEEIC